MQCSIGPTSLRDPGAVPYVLDHAYVHRWRGHGRSGKKPSAYDPVVGSYATLEPALDGLGHDAEMTGHDPEIGGHDRPEYALIAETD